jgi:predicted dehydrogenase
MKVAIIGVGHWGPHLLRNFSNHQLVDGIYCYDTDKEKMDNACKKYAEVKTVTHYDDILNNSSVSAVIVATPVTTHFEIAQQALQHGKHVLVEKPLTSTPNHGTRLVNIARENNCVLMVDHISVYNGAIRKIKDIIDASEIGNVMYITTFRTSQGLVQSDTNVVWDLAIHDLAIVDYLLPTRPKAISATGTSHVSKNEDIASVTLFFDTPCIAHLHVTWLSPIKVRRLIIGGTKKTIIFDDTETTAKIKVYSNNFESPFRKTTPDSHPHTQLNDYDSPQYDTTEPLALVTDEFIQSIEQKRKPLTNGEVGLKIVKILTTIDKSMKKRGAIVELMDSKNNTTKS